MPAEQVRAWQETATELADRWIAFDGWETLVRTDGLAPEALETVAVTAGAQEMLGLPLLLGRGFLAEDTRPGAPPVAMLSRGYWERTGADPGILDRTLRTEVGAVRVVGVLGRGVRFPPHGADGDLWVPLRDDLTWGDRRVRWVDGVWMRLPPGLEPKAAQERADALSAALADRHPSGDTWRVSLAPLGSFRADDDVRRAVWMLAGTVGAIFVIALVNGMNLALVRATARTREIGVRVAIGASTRRLLRQLLVEGLCLGTIGAAVSVALAAASVAGIRAIFPEGALAFSPYELTVERRTLAFLAVCSLAAGVLIGLLPALPLLGRGAAQGALAGHAADGRPGLRRLRQGLVVAQVASTMALLIIAGHLARGMLRLLAVDPGYEYEVLASAGVLPSATRYPDATARGELARRLEEALEPRLEVERATVVTQMGFATWTLQAEGREPQADQPRMVPWAAVGPDYLRTVGARLAGGRFFEPSDVGTSNVVVDEDLARFLWPGASAVGRRFRADEGAWMTVVGVVRELRLMGRDQRRGPFQFLTPAEPGRAGSFLQVLMRTSGEPEALLPVFRETLRHIDAEQWIRDVQTGAHALAEEEETPRFLLTVMGLLAGTATVLSAVGLYGVLSYAVGRRRRELGIRMTLGARGGRVRLAVIGEGLAVAAVGVALGAAGALALARPTAALLYEVDPRDPASYAVTAGVILLVAVGAAWGPASRATRVDPAEVLRAE
jgi:predicted permease